MSLRRRLASCAAAIALVAVPLASPAPVASATPAERVIEATGQLAILNGLGTLSLHAVAPPPPLGIPAPAGVATLVLQSTFEPPGPHVITINLFCTAVVAGPSGDELVASGPGSNGSAYFLRLAPGGPLGLWQFGWSAESGDGPCGVGGRAGIPLIGAAAITPAV